MQHEEGSQPAAGQGRIVELVQTEEHRSAPAQASPVHRLSRLLRAISLSLEVAGKSFECGLPYARGRLGLLRKIQIIVLLIWHLCVLFFLASTAFTQWPGLHHDCALYTTPVIKSAALGQWEFDGFLSALVEHESRSFNMHGQLYQFIFAKLLRCASYEALFCWTAALNVLTYLIYLTLGMKLCRPRFPRLGPWLVSGMAAVTALACLYLQGRPECLLPMLMAIPFALREWRITQKYAKWSAYVVLGLTVVLSPIPGVFCLLGVVAWMALRHGNAMIREIVYCGVASSLTAVLVLLVASPVNPHEWVLNTISDGNSATGFFERFGLPANLGVFRDLTLLDLPLWNVFCLGAFAMLAFALIRRRRWCLALVYAVIFIFVLMPKTLIYSYFGFMPILMLALSGRDADLLDFPEGLGRLPVALSSFFGVWGGAGLFRAMLLAVLFSSGGVSFSQTRAAIRQLETGLHDPREKIGFIWLARPSFMAFSTADNFHMALTLNVLEKGRKDPLLEPYEQKFDSKIRYVILPQLGHVTEAPPTLNEGMFLLERNGWSTQRARFCGLKLGGAMPGYQFALYARRE